jgi:hypothetical protein
MMREVAAMVAEAWDGRGSNLSNPSPKLDSRASGAVSDLAEIGPPSAWRHGGMANWRSGGLPDCRIAGLVDWRIERRPGPVGSRDSGPHPTTAFCVSNELIARLIPCEPRHVTRPMWKEHELELESST